MSDISLDSSRPGIGCTKAALTASANLSSTRRNQWILTGLGVLAGIIAVELALYPFVASWYWPRGPIRTTRAYTEGIAAAHFTADGFGTYGNRMTANPSIAGAPVSNDCRRFPRSAG